MKKIYNIHPFLFAVFPILSLYNYNKAILSISIAFYSLTIALLITALLFFTFKAILKDSTKAAVITSFLIIIFYIFGHYLNFLSSYLNIYYWYIILMFWMASSFGVSIILIKSRINYKNLTIYCGIVGFILTLFPLVSIGTYELRQNNILINKTAEINYPLDKEKNLPDIYYIILDGYARADVLEEIYNYDNSDFTNYLRNKGFYIGNESTANYPQTFLSVASSLNYEYINYLSDEMGEESNDRRPFKKLIKNNRVYKLLKENNYKFVVLPATWTGVDKNLNADIKINSTTDINSFNEMLISITPFGAFFNRKIGSDLHRKKILYNFDNIPKIAEIDSPTFVYAHLLIPHPPFVFGPNGEPINPKGKSIGLDGDYYFEVYPDKNEYKKKYKDAVAFVNKKLKTMVDEIIDKSDQSPIIILQADHGPGLMTYWEDPEKTNMKERLSILNAYYLPEEAKNNLYETITPVNSFRIILNYLFNTKLELLEDKNYFATWSHPYKLIDVTELLNY